MIRCPTLEELPPPPDGKTGWPWTEETTPLTGITPVPSVIEKSDGVTWPIISIVTPSYNQGQFIEETIRSVLLQGYPCLEYIIIDGGSSDESVELISRYERWLKHWTSEPDRGQSHAINKGLKHCKGAIFNWINSDDLLLPGALHAVSVKWKNSPHNIIAGSTINFDENGFEDLHAPKGITLENFVNWRRARENEWMWQQASTFLPGLEVQRVGGVREDLKFSMDHFLMIDILSQCDVVYIPNILAKFRLHDDSKTISSGCLKFSLERIRKLRSMPELHEYVTENELKQLEVSVLLTMADQEMHSNNYRAGFSSYTKALAESTFIAILIILRRSIIGRIVRKIIS